MLRSRNETDFFRVLVFFSLDALAYLVLLVFLDVFWVGSACFDLDLLRLGAGFEEHEPI
jgi:hypothetical protein